MLESKIQAKKIKELEAEGYFVIKLIKTNKNGIPDLLALPPNCKAKFIEVKQPGKSPRPLQVYWLKKLRDFFGFETEVYDGS